MRHKDDMTAVSSPHEPDRDAFLGHLRTALTHLYDPTVLRASPLAVLFGLEGRGDRATALQRVLTEAVEGCRPAGNAQAGSGAWRAYQVLRRRYIEQMPQPSVASDLGLSVRQLQREEKLARELLADQLWARFDLDASRALPAKQPQDTETRAGGRARELAWLRDNTPPELTDIAELARRTLGTAAPLLESLNVRAELEAADALAPAALQAVLVAQDVLSMVTAAARALPGGMVHLAASRTRGQVVFTAEGYGRTGAANEGFSESRAAGAPQPIPATRSEDLKIARELARLAGGELVVETPEQGPAIRLTLRMPVAEQAPVLIVDDNADAHQLYQRFLSGTRFHPVSLRDPVEAVTLAEQVRPCAVLLDVMMPGQDGWALLGRLREHPATHRIPVIVCTVLPQADLALTLGAADFLRKPVGRSALLAALDRCVSPVE
jgi:CheY-like chemotaxis protein